MYYAMLELIVHVINPIPDLWWCYDNVYLRLLEKCGHTIELLVSLVRQRDVLFIINLTEMCQVTSYVRQATSLGVLLYKSVIFYRRALNMVVLVYLLMWSY